MNLLENERFKVERVMFDDVVNFEGAKWVVHDDRAAVVAVGKWHVCAFENLSYFHEYAKKYDLYGAVSLFGAPIDAPRILGFDSVPCKSFAYLDPMPPEVNLPRGVTVKRLAPSLAQTVACAYSNRGGGYTVERMADIMKNKGVFGAIDDGKLAGFIGRHGDGSMGMLEVFDGFKRKGIGAALERFLIGYVMTFGRVPICDVYVDNPASLALQHKLGLTESDGYAFWFETEENK
ncbi:MAG: GNAT family N-acetyltransferase [Clostridiales bacterium]|nr:GNAT family N-acetyltransferase [Clostridiales bacterium]